MKFDGARRKVGLVGAFLDSLFWQLDERAGVTPEAREALRRWATDATRRASHWLASAEQLAAEIGLVLDGCPECERRGRVTGRCHLCGGSDRVIRVDPARRS